MARKLDLSINIIDLETTCWANDRDIPQGEVRDIIEIGIVELAFPTLEIKNKRSILVHPSRSRLSKFCVELTTITEELLAAGAVSFIDALDFLRDKYNSQERTWASWGAFDRIALQGQCEDLGIPYKKYFGRNHINLKNLYSLVRGLPYELGMASALEREGIPLEGTHHRGHDDAFNIAKIAQRMFAKKQEPFDYSQMKLETFELPNPGPNWMPSPDFKIKGLK